MCLIHTDQGKCLDHYVFGFRSASNRGALRESQSFIEVYSRFILLFYSRGQISQLLKLANWKKAIASTGILIADTNGFTDMYTGFDCNVEQTSRLVFRTF